MGWRYACFSLGGVITLLAIFRLWLVRLRETPKWLITQGRDDDAVATLTFVEIPLYAKSPYDTTDSSHIDTGAHVSSHEAICDILVILRSEYSG